ncbi:MAG TPA: hypothetical protein VE057_22330 [Archangium sp.]|nr:hypothetical protein [Archangium sp.]
MRNTLTLTALASLALIPMTSAGTTVTAPHPGTVSNTTYTATGSFHGAVDISSGRCGYWSVTSPFVGAVYWNITIRSTLQTCTAPTDNVAVHTWADGWAFRIKNFLQSSASYDKTCDRCELGKEGHHTHFQQDKSGTYDTSWYSGYTTKGEVIDLGEVIGVLN